MESGELPCSVSTPDVVVRDYAAADYSACRMLWVELTEHHRRLYEDPSIGGDDPGGAFDDYLAVPERVASWVADLDGSVVGLTGLFDRGTRGEAEPVVVTRPPEDARPRPGGTWPPAKRGEIKHGTTGVPAARCMCDTAAMRTTYRCRAYPDQQQQAVLTARSAASGWWEPDISIGTDLADRREVTAGSKRASPRLGFPVLIPADGPGLARCGLRCCHARRCLLLTGVGGEGFLGGVDDAEVGADVQFGCGDEQRFDG